MPQPLPHHPLFFFRLAFLPRPSLPPLPPPSVRHLGSEQRTSKQTRACLYQEAEEAHIPAIRLHLAAEFDRGQCTTTST